MNRVLVTGAHGFLGRHVASYFKSNGYEVIGMGHGQWDSVNPDAYGIDQWIGAEIEYRSLSKITRKLDCVVHCAGGSSVGSSIMAPHVEFERTVSSTINVLEYIRIKQPSARLVLPSSAAVYGEVEDKQICESEPLAPVSPYGFYKKITEELCDSYSRNFNLSVSVIRYFSIYGVGLKRQLIWDACKKLSAGNQEAIFYGTGEETRDWINVGDAVALIYLAAHVCDKYIVVNGGSGNRMTVLDILKNIKILVGSRTKIIMNGEKKEGDPMYYWANIEKQQSYGWRLQKDLENGLKEFTRWFIATLEK